jgi:hypothetical protein
VKRRGTYTAAMPCNLCRKKKTKEEIKKSNMERMCVLVDPAGKKRAQQ